MTNHIKKSRKQWICKTCDQPIEIGEKCFCNLESSLPYGRYIVPMVIYRVHLKCVKESDACCKEAKDQIMEILNNG